jgi:murein L,D-transpeptidase YcbB/YkuD
LAECYVRLNATQKGGNAVKFRHLSLALSVAGAFLGSAPALAQDAQPTPAAGPSIPAPTPNSVAAYYDTFHAQPIWFHGGVNETAVSQLIAVLKRAPFDGFAEGPQLANQVQGAVEQARSGTPADIAAADRVLSTAWVSYVQALKQPTTGMIYALPGLKPERTTAEQILLNTAAAPSLETYVTSTSTLNPIYAQLRDAAWAEAQSTGNLTPDPRLLANLDRARSIPATGRFMVVDSATQRLTLYEDGQPVDSMKVIVGTDQLPTPLISSVMYYVTFNPYWHAPDHLVRKTIAANYLRLGPKYFKSHGYEVLTEWTDATSSVDPTSIDWKAVARGDVHILVRQGPGSLNSMGKLKFPFPNPEDIYLHDTPGKELFNKDPRYLSNGCVRVEDATRLARWLLGTDPVAPSSDPEIRVPLPKGVPIVLTYLTAQVTDGKLTYLPDHYGWDKPQAALAASN